MGNRRRSYATAASAAVLTLMLTACPSTPADVTPAGIRVAVEVVDSFGASVNGQAAFQVGDAPWQALQSEATGSYELHVPQGEDRYGFTVNCPTGLQASSTKAMTIQATTDETTELRVTCPLSFVGSVTNVEGPYDATALGGADHVDVYSDVVADPGPGGVTAGAYGPIPQTVGAGRTIVGVANDAGGRPIALEIVRDLNLSMNAVVSVVFDLDDTLGLWTTPSFDDSVPAGWSPSVQVGFIAERGGLLILHAESTSSSTLAQFHVSQAQPGDLYLVLSSATQGFAPGISVGSFQLLASIDDLDLTLPQPWTVQPGVIPAPLPTFTGLAGLPSHPDIRGHVLLLEWDPILDEAPNPWVGPDAAWQFFVSAGWLGAATEYEPPDLTSLPGFPGAKPLGGESVGWMVGTVASTASTHTLLTSEAFPMGLESGHRTPLFPPLVEGIVNHISIIEDAFTAP